MYPTVGKVDLHTVDVVDLRAVVLSKHLLYLSENGIDIGIRSKVDAVLCNLIVGEGGTQFAGGTAFLCQ